VVGLSVIPLNNLGRAYAQHPASGDERGYVALSAVLSIALLGLFGLYGSGRFRHLIFNVPVRANRPPDCDERRNSPEALRVDSR
jgi:hypothetical protein